MNSHIVPVSSGLLALLGQKGIAGSDLFSREILVLRTIVAGTSYRNIHTVEKQLLADTLLQLQRETDNEHDELAIKVLLDKELLGYIPRSKNEVLARLMDAGKCFTAKITGFEWEGAWARIDIDVFLKD